MPGNAYEDSLYSPRSAQAAGPACVAAPGVPTAHEDLSAAGVLVTDRWQVTPEDVAGLPRCAA